MLYVPRPHDDDYWIVVENVWLNSATDDDL